MGEQQTINVQVPADQLREVSCRECGNGLFVPLLAMRVVPRFYSPTGKPERVALQVGFGCAACGAVLPPAADDDGQAEETKMIIIEDGKQAAKNAGFDVKCCRVCGCTDDHCSGCITRTGEPCHWVEEDLCSACFALVPSPSEPPPGGWDHGTHNIGEGGICPPECDAGEESGAREIVEGRGSRAKLTLLVGLGRDVLETTAGVDPEAWAKPGENCGEILRKEGPA